MNLRIHPTGKFWKTDGLLWGRELCINGDMYSISFEQHKYGIPYYFQKGRNPEHISSLNRQIKFDVLQTSKGAFNRLNTLALKHASKIQKIDLTKWNLGDDYFTEAYWKADNKNELTFLFSIKRVDDDVWEWSIHEASLDYNGTYDLKHLHITGQASSIQEAYQAIASLDI